MREELANEIYRVAGDRFKCSIDCLDGWFPLLMELAKEVAREPGAVVDTIKEKFGGLRVYASGSPELMAVVRFAEALSLRYCEVCGSPDGVETRVRRDPNTGKSQGMWLTTMCSRCHYMRDVMGTTGVVYETLISGGLVNPVRKEDEDGED